MSRAKSSRLLGFYKKPLVDRLDLLVSEGWLTREEANLLDRPVAGSFDTPLADSMSENVIGVHGLPLGLCLNLIINGEERVAPMVTEEPSVVAAASNAAKIARTGEGFFVETDDSIMAAQIQVKNLSNPALAAAILKDHESAIIEEANSYIPNMLKRGGGAREIETHLLPPPASSLCVHIHVDCRDAMGANLLNSLAESISPTIQRLVGGDIGLRILTNYADRRLVRARCVVPPESLGNKNWSDGHRVRDLMVEASHFAESDPYRAVTHNKGFMNGVDAVLLATGQDFRAVEAAAHAYASRMGVYRPLSVWRVTQHGYLEGKAELPMAVGVVGGAARAHPGVRLSLRMADVKGSRDLAGLAASVGLASNLAALKALATEGIQKGHMALHSRAHPNRDNPKSPAD